MSNTSGRLVHCSNCSIAFQVPELHSDLRLRVADLVRQDLRAEAASELEQKGDVDLLTGQELVRHITRSKNSCHHCHQPIPEAEEAICSNCQSFNLNW